MLPIIIKDKEEKVKNAKYYTKFRIVAKQKNTINETNEDTLIGKILSFVKKYDGEQVELTVGFGRKKKKKDTLNVYEIKKDITFLNNIEGIEAFQVDYKSDFDTIQDTFNLANERVQDWITIQKDKKHPILHEDILEKMKIKLINRIKSDII